MVTVVAMGSAKAIVPVIVLVIGQGSERGTAADTAAAAADIAAVDDDAADEATAAQTAAEMVIAAAVAAAQLAPLLVLASVASMIPRWSADGSSRCVHSTGP